jgi:ankyrin repeat protein
VDELLRHNADVNKRDSVRKTALMYAAAKGRASTVSSLLSANADMTLTERGAKTAAILAAEHGHHGIVKLLLEATSSPDGSVGVKTVANAVSVKSEDTETIAPAASEAAGESVCTPSPDDAGTMAPAASEAAV